MILTESFSLAVTKQRLRAWLHNLLTDRDTVGKLNLLLINCLLGPKYVLIALGLRFEWTRQSKLKLFLILIDSKKIEVKDLSIRDNWLAS